MPSLTVGRPHARVNQRVFTRIISLLALAACAPMSLEAKVAEHSLKLEFQPAPAALVSLDGQATSSSESDETQAEVIPTPPWLATLHIRGLASLKFQEPRPGTGFVPEGDELTGPAGPLPRAFRIV